VFLKLCCTELNSTIAIHFKFDYDNPTENVSAFASANSISEDNMPNYYTVILTPQMIAVFQLNGDDAESVEELEGENIAGNDGKSHPELIAFVV
jgi:hypothetical protein